MRKPYNFFNQINKGAVLAALLFVALQAGAQVSAWHFEDNARCLYD